MCCVVAVVTVVEHFGRNRADLYHVGAYGLPRIYNPLSDQPVNREFFFKLFSPVVMQHTLVVYGR